MKEKGFTIGLAFLIIILFTELIGLNIQIAFLSSLIVTSILAIILLNIKLKENFITKKIRIIIIILVISCAILSVFIIKPVYCCSVVLAVMILYKYMDKIDFQKIKFEFIKGFVIYYIIPLIVLLVISKLYSEGVYELSKLKIMWMVNYFEFVLIVVYEKIIVDIIIVMLVLAYKEILNSKIKVSINSKLIYILSIITILVILSTKIVLIFINMGVVDDRTLKLSIAVYHNNLQEYYELNFNPDLNVQENNIYEEENNYMLSFNDILVKGVWKWAELFYKTGTVSLKENVNKRNISKKEAINIYKEKSEGYIEILNNYKENLYLQIVCYIIIYLSNIICVTIIYKKIGERG